MNTQNPKIKIKIENHNLTPEDFEDLRRWENEGGLPSQKPNSFSSLPLPLHSKEIIEVIDCDIIVEDGQIFLLTEINVLSHH